VGIGDNQKLYTIAARRYGVRVGLVMLGLAIALPMTAEAATANTVVQSVVGSTISMTTSGTVELDATPTGSGVQTISDDTVSVSTYDTAGYTLKLAENGGSQNMVSGSNTISPSSGTQASPVAETAASWGYRVDGVGGFGAGPTSSASNASIGAIKFAAVPATASPDTLKTTSTTASNDTTEVWYGLAANTSTPTGTYANTVTYTATAN
jgi:hypothetical protein